MLLLICFIILLGLIIIPLAISGLLFLIPIMDALVFAAVIMAIFRHKKKKKK